MSSTQLLRHIIFSLALLCLVQIHTSAQAWRSSLYTPQIDRVVYTDTIMALFSGITLDSAYVSEVSLTDQIRRTAPKNYDPMLMELMVVPTALHIFYTPIRPQEENIKALDHSMSSLIAGDQFRDFMRKNTVNLSEIRQRTAVTQPSLVKTTWSKVPEPWREAKEGKKKNLMDNDNKSLAQLFEEAFEMNESMRALPKKKVSRWVLSGEENLQMSQMYINKHWAKGGEKNVALSSDMRAKAVYTNNRHSWENNGTHKVGFTYTSTLGTRVSNDAFELSSKYGFKAANKWYYSFMTTFKTQMFRNYASNDKEKKNLKSTLLSPAYIQLVVGMDYKVTDLSVLLSPYTASITVVADTADINQKDYGIAANRKSQWVNGFSVNTTWKKKITYGVVYSTKMELFYQYFEKNGQKRFNWENVLDMQINRFLTTRLLTTLRYFDNEKRKFQFKENFTIAFKYTF